MNLFRSLFWRFRKLPQSINSKSDKSVVSFCITHQNRFEFLKETLPKNLDDNRAQRDQTEIVLVDFNLNSQINDWIRDHFLNDIHSGLLSYYHTERLEKWSAPIAKNTAHALARGSILTNLDCDNFTGKNGGEFIVNQFKSHLAGILLWQHSGIKRDGTFGRMSIASAYFDLLGGYDEQFLEMSYQDADLKHRANGIGLKIVQNKNDAYNEAIKHERYQPENMTLSDMDRINKRKSNKNIVLGQFTANKGNYGIKTDIFKMNSSGELLPYHLQSSDHDIH
jgi:hypothetical protein